MKSIRLILMIALVCLSLEQIAVLAAPSALLTKEPFIKVGILTKQRDLVVSANNNFVIKDKSNGKVIMDFKVNTKVIIAVDGKSLKVNGKSVKATALAVELAKDNKNNFLALNGNIYRGRLEISKRQGANLSAVNILPIEEYLYGIVPGEMPATWHMEAIKSQAVAARSFALNSMIKHEADGFNVCATTHCQVYSGRSAEIARSTNAVQSTNGLIMMYDNRPIAAVFHSSSGGYTENSEEVWGSYTPYLRAVKDYDEGTPYYKWEKRFTPAKIQEILKASGYKLGKLQAMELSSLDRSGKQRSNDRTANGRVKTMRFIGDKGSVTITGNQMRSMFGLNSTLFDIGLYNKSTRKTQVSKENIRRIQWRSDEEFVISGFGWGHGLGMSQWGAKKMAEKVSERETMYFKEILSHYYKNCKLQKIY